MLRDHHHRRLRRLRGPATGCGLACALLALVVGLSKSAVRTPATETALAANVPKATGDKCPPVGISDLIHIHAPRLVRLPAVKKEDPRQPRQLPDTRPMQERAAGEQSRHRPTANRPTFGVRPVVFEDPLLNTMKSSIEPVPLPLSDEPLSPPLSRMIDSPAGSYGIEPLLSPNNVDVQPPWLRDPDTRPLVAPESTIVSSDQQPLLLTYMDAPLGYTGRSGVMPTEAQSSSHFVPIEDRWRLGFPEWDRYGNGHPPGVDYPYTEGNWWDPYNQNVLKGDYPIIGQHTFFNLTATSLTLLEYRQVPTATTPFESTVRPSQEEFFGDPEQFFAEQLVRLSFNVFHGDAAFKPFDWQARITPVFNANYLDVEELGVVDPDVRKGTTRGREDWSLEEWFIETKLADLSPNYDFVSLRAGSQLFVSDFRGFIFADTNRGVRLFGTRLANRDQFNFIWFDQAEKDTNSELNTFEDRHQNTFIANYYRQDFIWPGYTAQASFHYNRDKPSFRFDDNDFLARPDAAGVFLPHEVSAYYIGWSGNGHINRFNISHACYWAFGQDELNPLAGKKTDINAQMVAVEVSYDRDWVRFRTSFLWASGDNDIDDAEAEGFDAIFDNPNFAGGEFSYWNRQAIRLFGVNLVQRKSIVPNLRSSKTEGQTNFVNPGLFLFNVGMDADLTPKLKVIGNVNFLWFQEVAVLEQFTFQENIDRKIGTDLSLGIEYRPALNDNAIVVAGISGLLPGEGFEDLYNPLTGDVDGLFAGFAELILTY